jgi:predicted TIM-barrel fold metal-dependent hydrolase
MDRKNIRKTVISISAPGTHLVHNDHVLGTRVTRDANEYMASICRQQPLRFTFFASLPLPAVEESLAEIDYAANELNCAGFTLVTNFHGTYLGDQSMDAVFAKLNSLKAIIFIHSTNCHHVHLMGQRRRSRLP